MLKRTLVGELLQLDHARRIAFDLGHHVGQKEGRIIRVFVHAEEGALGCLFRQAVLTGMERARVGPDVLEANAGDARLEQTLGDRDDRHDALPHRCAADHAASRHGL